MSDSRHSLRRWSVALAKVLLLALVAWGVHRSARSAWDELARQHWRPSELRPGWLMACGCLYLASLTPPGLFWRRVLLCMGQTVSVREALRAYLVGHLGKYVPGKAMVLLLRAGLLRRSNVGGTVTTVSVFYETFSTMAAGSLCAALILAAGLGTSRWLAWVAVGLALLTGLPTVPAIFRRLVRWSGAGRFDADAAARLDQLAGRVVLRGWLTLALGWLLAGASLWCALRAAGFEGQQDAWRQILICNASAALAVVAGFLSFVPGGFVVREAVLLALLGAEFGEAGALVAALVARLTWLVAELVISGILYPLPPPATNAATPQT